MLVNLFARHLVINLWSQLDKVIGLQFVNLLTSLPIFGSNLSIELLCDSGRVPDCRASLQDCAKVSPKRDQYCL